jgi:hypothetical protein
MSKFLREFWGKQLPVGEGPTEYRLEELHGFIIPNGMNSNDKANFVYNFKVALAKLIDPRYSTTSFQNLDAAILPIYFLKGVNGKCAFVFPSQAYCDFFRQILDIGPNCMDLKSLEWDLNDRPYDGYIRIKIDKMMENAEKLTTVRQLVAALDTIRGGSKRKTPRRFRKSRSTRKSRKSRKSRRTRRS